VVGVSNEEELERALERVDPEILLLSARDPDDDEDPLEQALDLLPDVPAGKLAVADVPVSSREAVVALERAGVDAVIVGAVNVAELVGGPPPEV
jgi:indole-3-glycerol phosphate synthase